MVGLACNIKSGKVITMNDAIKELLSLGMPENNISKINSLIEAKKDYVFYFDCGKLRILVMLTFNTDSSFKLITNKIPSDELPNNPLWNRYLKIVKSHQ